MLRTIFTSLIMLSIVCLAAPTLFAQDWYISAANGKGKKATKEKPAKDIGNIASKLVGGDVVHIAGGTYLGRGKNGSTTINVPVTIIGGYDETFSKRDPWGEHKTIFSGDNLTSNYVATPSLFIDLMKYDGPASDIKVDGIIIDQSGRNRYDGDAKNKLIPRADPKTGKNPSPSMGGLVIRVSKSEKFDRGPRWNIVVKNNIVMNVYGNGGALSVSGYKGTKVLIDNNLVIQTSGAGLFCGSKFAGSDSLPEFTVTNNTVLFTWDSGFSQGSNFGLDSSTTVSLQNNVFGFSDFYAIENGRNAKNILLANNLITGAGKADYLEFDTKMDVENMLDEAENLHDDSDENITAAIKIPVSKEFALLYGSRVVVDRNKAEAGVAASNSGANELRSMLGLPLQAGSVEWPTTPVYINAISIDDAIAAGSKKYQEKYGCSKPALK